MQQLIFKPIVHVQAILLLVLPALAAALHNCSTAGCQNAAATVSTHDCLCGHTHTPSKHSPPHRDESNTPHDCSSCPVCQVLSAPRIPVVLCQPVLVTQQAFIDSAEQPQHVHSRPIHTPQCRAPPAVEPLV